MAATIVSDSATQIVVTARRHGRHGGRDGDDGGRHVGHLVGRSVHLRRRCPTVTGVSPRSGPLAGGTSVTITGTGLTNATAVDFGGIAATIVSDSATRSWSPARRAGRHGGRDRDDGRRHFGHLVGRPVHLCGGADGDGHQSDAGPLAGGTTVTITGTGLANATAVKFGTIAATIVSDTATQIVATSPAAGGHGGRDGVDGGRHVGHLGGRPVHLCRGADGDGASVRRRGRWRAARR